MGRCFVEYEKERFSWRIAFNMASGNTSSCPEPKGGDVIDELMIAKLRAQKTIKNEQAHNPKKLDAQKHIEYDEIHETVVKKKDNPNGETNPILR